MSLWVVLITTVQVQTAPHKAELSHELIAGAASYEVVPCHALVSRDIHTRARPPRHMRIT